MLQSLSMKDYPKDMFKEYGLSIYDECHHLSAEVFSRAFFKVYKIWFGTISNNETKRWINKSFEMVLGPIVCKIERKGGDNVL